MSETRDRKATIEHFNDVVNTLEELNSGSWPLLETAVELDLDYSASLVDPMLVRAVAMLSARFSAGVALEDLRDEVGRMGRLWPEIYEGLGERLSAPNWQQALGSLQSDAGMYAAAVNGLSFAFAYGDDAALDAMLRSYVVAGTGDPIIAAIASLHGRNFSTSDSVLPPLYDGWLAIVEASAAERSALLEAYVVGWKRVWSKAKMSVGPKDPLYCGEWCFEVVPLVVGLEIDDAGCRGVAEYPSDLVDFARSNQ